MLVERNLCQATQSVIVIDDEQRTYLIYLVNPKDLFKILKVMSD